MFALLSLGLFVLTSDSMIIGPSNVCEPTNQTDQLFDNIDFIMFETNNSDAKLHIVIANGFDIQTNRIIAWILRREQVYCHCYWNGTQYSRCACKASKYNDIAIWKNPIIYGNRTNTTLMVIAELTPKIRQHIHDEYFVPHMTVWHIFFIICGWCFVFYGIYTFVVYKLKVIESKMKQK